MMSKSLDYNLVLYIYMDYIKDILRFTFKMKFTVIIYFRYKSQP